MSLYHDGRRFYHTLINHFGHKRRINTRMRILNRRLRFTTTFKGLTLKDRTLKGLTTRFTTVKNDLHKRYSNSRRNTSRYPNNSSYARSSRPQAPGY